MNNLQILVALATAPSSAFAELRERPRFWFPLLLLVITTVGLVYWYYSVVDIEWLKDQMFANNPTIPEAKRAAAMGMLTRTTLMWTSVVSAFIALPIVLVVSALYWLVAGKIAKLTPDFSHWFAFSCWTSLPVLISTVVAVILLLMSNSPQISLGVTQPLSLNELIFHRPFGSPGQTLLGSLGIPGFLSWVLMIIGIRVWSQRSWLFSVLYVLAPVVVFYGIWAFFSFR